jgi:hypothetical protein
MSSRPQAVRDDPQTMGQMNNLYDTLAAAQIKGKLKSIPFQW